VAPPPPEDAAVLGASPADAAALAPRTRRSPRVRLAINLATVAITVAFTYFALNGIDLQAAWEALRAANLWWCVPALVAFGLGNVARGLRWRSLFAPGRRPPRGTTLNAMMIGYLYNSILPARAGEAARVMVLRRRSSAPVAEITGTVVLERIYDTVVILLIFFVTEPWLPHLSWVGTAAIVAVVLALAVAAAVAVLAIFGHGSLRLLLRPLGRFASFSGERLERLITEVAHGLSGLRHWRVSFEALVWTTLGWLFSILCAYLLTLAFHMHLPFAASVLVMVAIALSMILPSPPAAVGVFEGAVLIALHAYKVPHSTALPYALVLHLVNFIPFVLVGVLLLHHNARRPVPAGVTPRA
jgi:hypothetical protein